MFSGFLNLLRNGQEKATSSTEQSKKHVDESTVKTITSTSLETSSVSSIDKLIPEVEQGRISLNNISSSMYMLENIEILFKKAIKDPKQAKIVVASMKNEQKNYKNYFITLCTNLIIKLRNDFLLKDSDDEDLQAIALGILIGEMYNQNLLTWQNIEAHSQRLTAYGYISKGSTNLIGRIFTLCELKLKQNMPAGCFKSFQSKIVNNYNISLNKKSTTPIKQNNFTLTYADFEKILIKQQPSYENVIKHLKNVDLNENLDKYVNLIVSEALKKPSMNKTYADSLNEMRLIVKKKNVIELKLNVRLHDDLTKYFKIVHRNLKSERPQMQLQAHSLGTFIGKLHKIDLLQSQTIEDYFKTILSDKLLKEGGLDLVYNIIQSCDSELNITLGTDKLNSYITKLKSKINPFNMSSSICNKVKSMRNHKNIKQLIEIKPNSNAMVGQSSKSISEATSTTSQRSNKDELLKKLKELQQHNDGDDSAMNKDLLNAYNEHNQTPIDNLKSTFNFANAIDNLSIDNYEEVMDQLKDFQIDTKEKVAIFVDSIYQRKMKGPVMYEMGAELCKKLYVISTSSIKDAIVERVIYLFEINSTQFKIDLRLVHGNESDKETDKRISGFMTFVVEFFKVELLAVKYVHTHMQRLLDLNYISQSSVYLSSILLKSCGAQIYETNHQLGVLDKFVSQLKNFCQNTETEKEVKLNVEKIIEMHQNKWHIIKEKTDVKIIIKDKEPSEISREIIKIQTELSECLNAKPTTDESSNKFMKTVLSCILYDPSSIPKFVKEIADETDDKLRMIMINLLMVVCKQELNKNLNIVSLCTGKDEFIDLIYKIQNEDDSQKRKELKMILDSRLDAPNNAVIIVKFIGELYNSDLLDNRTVIDLDYLLDMEYINENTIMCFCKLLATVGNKLMSNAEGLEIYQKYAKKFTGYNQSDFGISNFNRKKLFVICFTMNTNGHVLSETLSKDYLTYIVHQLEIYQIDIKDCARFIFENAIFYTRAASYYAKLCKEISMISLSTTDPKEENLFMFHLLSICEEEFKIHMTNKARYRSHDISKKTFLTIENYFNKKMIKVMEKGLSDLQRRANGLGNFIGELYKLGLVTKYIFWGFVDNLMASTATCEFCIDFTCHLLLSADGNFKSKIERIKLKNILDYFEFMCKKFECEVDSRVWFIVHKVITMKFIWMRKISRNLRRFTEEYQEIDFILNDPFDVSIYEILNATTKHNVNQIAEQVRNFASMSVRCFYGIVEFIVEKGVTNLLPDNMYAHLCANVNVILSSNSNRSFKNLLISSCQNTFETQVCNRLESSASSYKQKMMKKRLMGTVQFIGALFNVDLLCGIIMLRVMKALLDPGTISEVSIECLSHFMTTIGGIDGNEKKFKDSIIQLRTIIKERKTKFRIEIQDSLWNLLELLKTLDKSENTSFLGQTLSVKFKKKNNSKKFPSTTNNSSTESTSCRETKIMYQKQEHKTAIEDLDTHIIPTIFENLKSVNIFLVNEQLKWTIKFIFETLIDDPTCVAVNAKFCCKLGQQIGIFNSCLIDFCQREFESHRFQAPVYQSYDVHLQTILATVRDAKIQKEYYSMLKKSIEKESHRSISIVNFICELYRLNLMPEQLFYLLITINIIFPSNDGQDAEQNKDVLNAYNENNKLQKDPFNYGKSSEIDNVEPEMEIKVSLVNQEITSKKDEKDNNEGTGGNIKTSALIQQIIKDVNTDHENAKKWSSKIAITTNGPISDQLIAELMIELKRNLSIVTNRLENEDIICIIKEIGHEDYFDKREELKNVLIARLDAPHNAIGNVKLFAELYNIGLLDYEEMIKIMNSFLESESINPVTIECFCEFMSTVGSKMDHEYHSHFVYFAQKIESISKNGALKMDNRILSQDDNQNGYDTEQITKLRLQPVTTTLFFAELYKVGIISCKILEYFMKVFLDPVFINKITLECFCVLLLNTKEMYCQKNGKGFYVEMIKQVENNCHNLEEHSFSKAKGLFDKVVQSMDVQSPHFGKESETSHENNSVTDNNIDINYISPIYILNNINLESMQEIKDVLSLIFMNLHVKPNFAKFYANACYQTFNGKLSSESIQIILETLMNQNNMNAHNDLLVIRNEQFEDLTVATRIIGLVNFINEFYKVGFLLPKHVHAHIKKLLNKDMICDCSCHLTCIIMFSCGDNLHIDNYNLDVLQSFIVKLIKYCDNMKISSKTRFMVQKLNKLQKRWKTIVANFNDGDPDQKENDEIEIVQKFRLILNASTAINIKETLAEIEMLNINKDMLKCLQYLFSMVEVNKELVQHYGDVCKEMNRVSNDKITFKKHVEELTKMMVRKIKDTGSSAKCIAKFLGRLYMNDMLSTYFMIMLFETMIESQKTCDGVLEFFNTLLLICGHDLSSKIGHINMSIYTEWIEDHLKINQIVVPQQISDLYRDNEQLLSTSTSDIELNEPHNLLVYSHVLNTSYKMELVTEPVLMEKQELQQIVPKIDDLFEFPPVLGDKKNKKYQTKNTLKKIYNSELPEILKLSTFNNEIKICNETQKSEKNVTVHPVIADKSISNDDTIEINQCNATIDINLSPLSFNHCPLKSKYKDISKSSQEFGSTSILDDLMMNNLTGALLDESIIEMLKNVASDPSSTTEKIRNIYISCCNQPIDLHKRRDFFLKRLIMVSWKKFSNAIYLANAQLGYDKIISMMEKIQCERNSESRKLLKAELEDSLDLRFYAVNLVKFLGELVNFGIVSPKIIRSVKPLLDININTIKVECFCEFYKTVGSTMELELGDKNIYHLFGYSAQLSKVPPTFSTGDYMIVVHSEKEGKLQNGYRFYGTLSNEKK
ncbi:unnamed protein product [Diamesa serratosioi]